MYSTLAPYSTRYINSKVYPTRPPYPISQTNEVNFEYCEEYYSQTDYNKLSYYFNKKTKRDDSNINFMYTEFQEKNSGIQNTQKIDEQFRNNGHNVKTGSKNETTSRPNHSVIEKRRRDKMKCYLQELASLVPMCKAIPANKLDKFTLLKLTMQHINAIKQAPKPSVLENKLPSDKSIINNFLAGEAKNSFLAIVSLNKGTFYYASETIVNVLQLIPCDVIGHSIYEFLHPEDTTKFQASINEFVNEEGKNSYLSTFMTDCLPQDGMKEYPRKKLTFKMAIGNKDKTAIRNSPEIKTHANSRAPSKSKVPFSESYRQVRCCGQFQTFPITTVVPAHLIHKNSKASLVNCFMFVCTIDEKYHSYNKETRKSTSSEQFTLRISKKAIIQDQRNFEIALGYTNCSLKDTLLYKYVVKEDIELLKLAIELTFESKSTTYLPLFRIIRNNREILLIKARCKSLNVLGVVNVICQCKVIKNNEEPYFYYPINTKEQKRKHKLGNEDFCNTVQIESVTMREPFSKFSKSMEGLKELQNYGMTECSELIQSETQNYCPHNLNKSLFDFNTNFQWEMPSQSPPEYVFNSPEFLIDKHCSFTQLIDNIAK